MGWTNKFMFALALISLQIQSGAAALNDTLRQLSCEVKIADFYQYYQGSVKQGEQISYVFTYIKGRNKTAAVRLLFSAPGAHDESPVQFVVHQALSIMAWHLPVIIYDRKEGPLGRLRYPYTVMGRTLCPNKNYKADEKQQVRVDVTSPAVSDALFNMSAFVISDFELTNNEKKHVIVTPSEPQYFEYSFAGHVNTVVMKAESQDSLCMTLSVQSGTCPVFDLGRNVEFSGTHQTVSKKGAITVQRTSKKDMRIFIVLVLHPNDNDCTGSVGVASSNISNATLRMKNVSIIVEPSIPKLDYRVPVIVTLVLFLMFYITAFILSVAFYYWRKSRQSEDSPDSGQETPTVVSLTPQEEEKEIEDYRNKIPLLVADISKDCTKSMSRKYWLYSMMLVVIAIFYGLPVFQLVANYKTVIYVTGDEDTCFFNFYCAHPLSIFSSFNNVFSNIGYIMLGVLYIILVRRRSIIHKNEATKDMGLPQRFGLSYALGIGLVMEGFLSGCYHVCPCYPNFQFDTSFMYMLAWLCLLKMYQARHTDMSPEAESAYLIMAHVIMFVVLGVMTGTVAFWVTFAFILILCSSIISVYYYFGWCRIDGSLFRQFWTFCRGCHCWGKPKHMNRCFLILVSNIMNVAFAIYGITKRPGNFPSLLLYIALSNLAVYVIFYCIMKRVKGERMRIDTVVYILLSIGLWIPALYFFTAHLTDWEVMPAQSREGNRPCILLGFYDSHDVWHMLSAMSLFFTFMVFLTLDDDLTFERRSEIEVF